MNVSTRLLAVIVGSIAIILVINPGVCLCMSECMKSLCIFSCQVYSCSHVQTSDHRKQCWNITVKSEDTSPGHANGIITKPHSFWFYNSHEC